MTTALRKPQFEVDRRFQSAIVTPADVATLIAASRSTIYSWTRDTGRRGPIVHSIPARRGWPTIPLVGLVEAHTMRSLRNLGVPLKKLAVAVKVAREEHGDPYALAHEQLFHDGIDVFRGKLGELFRLDDAQMPIWEVVEKHVRPLEFSQDGYADAFRIPLPHGVHLEIRAGFNAGRPSFPSNRVPAFAVLGELQAGGAVGEVAKSYNLSEDEVRAVADTTEKVQSVF